MRAFAVHVSLYVLALFAAAPARAQGAPPFDLHALRTHTSVVPVVGWLEDPSNKLTLEDLKGLGSSRFHLATGETLGFGFRRAAFWLRFDVANRSPNVENWLLEIGHPHLSEIDLYAVHTDGRVDHLRAGNLLPFAQRAIEYPLFAFPLRTPAGETTRFFVRVKSDGAVLVQLNAWRMPAFLNHLVSRSVWMWLLWGGIALMAAFNLGVAALLRSREYVYTALMLLAEGFVVSTLSGETFQYLLPDHPELASHCHAVSYLLLSLAIQACTGSVLRQLAQPPSSVQLLRFTIPISFAVLCFAAIGPMWLTIRVCLVYVVGITIFALYMVHTLRAISELRFHLLSFGILFLALPIAVAAYANFVSPHPLLFLAANLSIGLHAVFTSWALPQRIREMGDRLARMNVQLQSNVVELESALARAEQGTRVKDQFLATMSHELRTPLNAIINVPLGLLEEFEPQPAARCAACGAVFLLDRDDSLASLVCEDCGSALQEHDDVVKYRGDPERSVRFLKKIERCGKHLLQMVNDVLDVSKMAAGRLEIEPFELSLGVLISDTADEMSELAARKRVQIDLDLAAGAKPSCGDSVRLKQVLFNLLSNAIKFSPADSLVLVRWRQTPEEELISVIDRGIGIASEHHERIFNSFEQVHGGSRLYGGTGLGLSISRELVRRHGGELWVESAEGQGSTFTFRVPRPLPEQQQQQPAA